MNKPTNTFFIDDSRGANKFFVEKFIIKYELGVSYKGYMRG